MRSNLRLVSGFLPILAISFVLGEIVLRLVRSAITFSPIDSTDHKPMSGQRT